MCDEIVNFSTLTPRVLKMCVCTKINAAIFDYSRERRNSIHKERPKRRGNNI